MFSQIKIKAGLNPNNAPVIIVQMSSVITAGTKLFVFSTLELKTSVWKEEA